jgi:hypothetical protein
MSLQRGAKVSHLLRVAQGGCHTVPQPCYTSLLLDLRLLLEHHLLAVLS